MISVIIPTYNTAQLIERTIRSVLAQSCQDFEILIVDDCSTDDTLTLVKAIQDERIRIFEQEENRGPAAARNRGLTEAKGEYCAFLDGDDYWEPDFLKETSGFLDVHPEAVAVFCGQKHNTARELASIRPRCLCNREGCFEKPVVLEDFFGFWQQEKYLVCTGSIMIRTACLREIGGQREDLRICEDLELWCLVGFKGKIGFIPRVLFVSDGNTGVLSRKQVYRKLMKRWIGAPTVAEWSRRHEPLLHLSKTYLFVRGEVASMLVYAYVMRGDFRLAQNTIKEYRPYFPNNKAVRLFEKFAGNRIFWFLFCTLLRFRERFRNLY